MALTVRDRVNRILENYFSTPLPKDLEEEILMWILGDGHETEKDDKLEELWSKIVRYEERPLNEEALVHSINEVKRLLGLPPMELPHIHTAVPAKRKVLPGRRALRYAAVAAIPLMMLGGAYIWLNRQSAAPDMPAVVAQTAEISETASDSEKELALPDGSRVWLEPGSTLSYADDFGQERSVRLEGQAYFDVEHDDERPFVVNAGKAVVTVLGTEFYVRAYLYEDETEVVLNSGKVKVEVDDGEYILSDRECLVYSHADGIVTEQELRTGESADIRSFSFEQEPLVNVLAAVCDRYGIEIKYNPNAISGEHVTIKLQGDEPLDSLLTWLRDITGTFDYTIEDGVVVIR